MIQLRVDGKTLLTQADARYQNVIF